MSQDDDQGRKLPRRPRNPLLQERDADAPLFNADQQRADPARDRSHDQTRAVPRSTPPPQQLPQTPARNRPQPVRQSHPPQVPQPARAPQSLPGRPARTAAASVPAPAAPEPLAHQAQQIPTRPGPMAGGPAARIAPEAPAAQPPVPPMPPTAERPSGGTPARGPRPRRRWRRWLAVVLVLCLVWVGAIAWAGKTAWDKVTKVEAIPTSDRPAQGKGSNIVLVGSDSRTGLSDQERRALGTGTAEGNRTDSIMVLHLPESGEPTLVSLPRDSYVSIPGHQRNKINASFSFGGPQLLVKTVEQATDLRIDGYLEIGFGGFATIVDAVGGVRMCLPKAMKDEKAHIDLPAGCQNLNGANALGYVRARYSDPRGDLGRAERQRQLLGALMGKIATPANVLNPLKLRDLGASGAQGVSVNEGMSPWQAGRVMLGLRKISGGSGQSIQVPVADESYQTRSGEAVLWDRSRAAALFEALKNDRSPNVAP